MKNIIQLSVVLLIVFAIFSCSKTEVETFADKTRGEQYFPLSVGNWWMYELDSIIYDIKGNRLVLDTSHHIIRETIVDTLMNNINKMSYKIERQQLNNDSIWVITNIWWVYKDLDKVVRTEDNLSFIKLVFTVKEDITWDGNAFIEPHTELIVRHDVLENTFIGWDYIYLNVGQKETINDVSYEDVITVDASLPKTIGDIQWRSTQEKYAKGVGLIYKNWELLDINTSIGDTSLSVYERSNEGFLLSQRLINYAVK